MRSGVRNVASHLKNYYTPIRGEPMTNASGFVQPMNNISKTFPGANALDDIILALK
jgi:hypothetical protein